MARTISRGLREEISPGSSVLAGSRLPNELLSFEVSGRLGGDRLRSSGRTPLDLALDRLVCVFDPTFGPYPLMLLGARLRINGSGPPVLYVGG